MDNVKKMEFRIQLLIFLDIFSFPYKYGDYSSDIGKEIALESSSVCHGCGSSNVSHRVVCWELFP